MTGVLVDLGVLLRPSALASSLAAYVPSFQKIRVFEVDYARLLYSLAGVLDEDRSDTIYNAKRWVLEYRDRLRPGIDAARSLEDPFAAALLLDRAAQRGWVEFVPFSWVDGYLTLFPANARESMQRGRVPSNFLELYDRHFVGFLGSLKDAVEEEAKAFDHAVGHRNFTLQGDLEDSRIAGIGFSSETAGIVSTCNPRYWSWLQRTFAYSHAGTISTPELARVIECSPTHFSVDDVLRLVENAPACEALLAANEEVNTRIQSPRELGKESLFLLLQEVVGAIASPLVTTFELARMVLRIDLNRWRRRP